MDWSANRRISGRRPSSSRPSSIRPSSSCPCSRSVTRTTVPARFGTEHAAELALPIIGPCIDPVVPRTPLAPRIATSTRPSGRHHDAASGTRSRDARRCRHPLPHVAPIALRARPQRRTRRTALQLLAHPRGHARTPIRRRRARTRNIRMPLRTRLLHGGELLGAPACLPACRFPYGRRPRRLRCLPRAPRSPPRRPTQATAAAERRGWRLGSRGRLGHHLAILLVGHDVLQVLRPEPFGAGQALGSLSSRSSPCQASSPSRTASTTIPSAATGSAHHHPNAALSTRPASSTADSQAHSNVSAQSATSVRLPSCSPVRRLAHASVGMTNSEQHARTIPMTEVLRPFADHEVADRLNTHVHRQHEERDGDHAEHPLLSCASSIRPRRCLARNCHTTTDAATTSIEESKPKPTSAIRTRRHTRLRSCDHHLHRVPRDRRVLEQNAAAPQRHFRLLQRVACCARTWGTARSRSPTAPSNASAARSTSNNSGAAIR